MTATPQTLTDILAAHRAGRSPVETMRAAYARLAAVGDEAIFISLRPEEEAVAAAAALERDGPDGKPLYGAPFAVKDNIDVFGFATTAACPAFSYRPERSARVVERLMAAGAIPIGKTNLDQFATGLVGVRSPYGAPRNALRPDLAPGGSSSGSAVAVALGIVPFALGTDTAGSGRVPAALNGIVGLKPTLGAVSTRGAVPACRTLDCVSVFAATARDAFAAFQIMAGYDPDDPFSKRIGVGALGAMPPRLRIAAPRKANRIFYGDAMAEAAFAADLERLVDLGAELVEIDFEPFFEAARLLYEGAWVAERYAAVKSLIENDPDALYPITRTIIEGARKHDAVAAFEGFYKLAELRRRCETVWSKAEILAVPSIPTVYTLAQIEADPIGLNSNLGVYTNFVNLLDLAALSIPFGRRGDGLPSSLTLIGPAGSDAFLASAAVHLSGVPFAEPVQARSDLIELAVVGAHLSGMPLNRELVESGGVFLREAKTVPDYRLYKLPDSAPPKPGLLRVGRGEGHSIALEVWALDAAGFGRFASRIPSPLGIGSLALADGSAPKGFLVEAEAVKMAQDISHHGGWRAFVSQGA